jgi:hypothetical protein
MIGGHLVEKFRLNELQTWLKQFGSNYQCKNTTHQEHSEAKPTVKRADVFVVSRIQPPQYALFRAMVMVVVMICVYYFTHNGSLLSAG